MKNFCKSCGTDITAKRSNARFCSDKCRKYAWRVKGTLANCSYCGEKNNIFFSKDNKNICNKCTNFENLGIYSVGCPNPEWVDYVLTVRRDINIADGTQAQYVLDEIHELIVGLSETEWNLNKEFSSAYCVEGSGQICLKCTERLVNNITEYFGERIISTKVR